MLERKEIKKSLGISLTAIGILALTGCTSAKPTERVINVDQDPSTNATVLQGKDWTVRKIADSVFKLSGNNQEKAVDYISSRCEVLSIGAWELKGLYGSSIGERVVVVRNGSCIDELKK